MIKQFFILAGILSLTFNAAHAQFVNLQLKIEPELSAAVEQPLDFGTQIVNSGPTNIDLGDVSMGIFSIRAYHTQNVYLNLNLPEYLEHLDPAIDDRIPLELHMSYNNSGVDSYTRAEPLVNNNGMVSIHENTAATNDKIWQILYIYVYGYIDIGNVAGGVYTGEIVLSIDYD